MSHGDVWVWSSNVKLGLEVRLKKTTTNQSLQSLFAPSHQLSGGPASGGFLHQPVVTMKKQLLCGKLQEKVEKLHMPIGKMLLEIYS